MQSLLKLLTALVPLIAALNFGGGIIGGIWAVANGDWWAIGYAFLGLVVSHFAISILLIPGFAVAAFGASAAQRGNIVLARVASGLSSLWQVGLMGAWALFATAAFLGHPRQSSQNTMLLLGYGASTGPWAYLASKDMQSGNEYSGISVFLFQTGYLVGAILLVLDPQNGLAFLVPLRVGPAINWVLQQAILKKRFRPMSHRDLSRARVLG